MAKSRRKERRRRASAALAGGFEFGFVPRVLYANTSSIDFNNHMIAAKIAGCAYGFDQVEGYPAPMPTLTLIGKNPVELVKASKCLEDWGCAEDGDAVDVTIILKRDGGYLLGMQPNFPRLMNRAVRDSALVDLLLTGATWIKRMDSTNPMLHQWREYRASRLAPIKFLFGTASVVNGIPQIETVRIVEDTIAVVKFGVQIITEGDEPDHWFLDIVAKRTPTRNRREGPEKTTPAGVARVRRDVFKSAFPVSQERIRRLLLPEKVRTLAGQETTTDQITQAAINVRLSHEWTDGKQHYDGIESLEDQWWDKVRRRVEVCGDGRGYEEIEPTSVIEQLKRDVEFVLRRHGATVSSKFATNQRLFMRLGYGGR